ncbi:sugar ABC transporter permease [Paenibacillus sp. FSL R5-0912]|uniref:carbohydrate ABC transporter permease n=1 Tax=unclassified Paenibacillus TaxID=185978 RepID=UPI0004F8FF0F|nr:sugar ABC transporter permease [Paenibacillus sp. FSL R5-0912]AIQ43211.1 sugar ABC transporter permease [Paenibacillus sp. FSL R5-0912]
MKTTGWNFRRNVVFQLFVLPALIGYLIFYIYPLAQTAIYSFTNYSLIHPHMKWIGIDNYLRLFRDDSVLIGIKNTVIYALLMTLLQNVLAIPLAIALNRPLKSRNWLRLIFFAPAVLSPLVVGFLWSYLMSSTDYGLINQALQALGLNSINWLGNPKLALYSILLTQVWQWTGYAMIIYLANLQGISKDYYEAASIDGAKPWTVFIKITLPLLLPSISFNTVMAMIGGLKVFDVIFSMTGGGPGHSTETIVMTLMNKGITEAQFGYGSAFAVVFSFLIMIVAFIQLKVLNKWEERMF